MNQLTSIVLSMKSITKGSEAWDMAFSEVFYGVQASVESIVNGYAYSLKGDTHAGESIAIGHLETCVEKFQYKGYEFLTFYKKALENKLIDLVRSINADKAKHNTSYEVSLSIDITDMEGGSYSVEDRFHDAALQSSDSYTLESELSLSSILDGFSEKKPVEAGVIELIIQYSAEGYQKRDFSQAITSYYDADSYTNVLQARVSRALKSFKKYAAEIGYVFNF